ncbi:MAG: 2-oxoacid:acceptor oxidoreductase family protein [Elusimicrobiota bacterium]
MTKIIIAGFGGQGVMLAGNLLAWAVMENNKAVTFFPSYGAEMRGGTAKCFVVISETKVGSPIVTHPDIALILNQQSFDKYAPLIKEDGVIIYNSSLIKVNENIKVKCVPVSATSIAERLGDARMANIVFLGVLAKLNKIVVKDILETGIKLAFESKGEGVVKNNLEALNTGYNSL